MKTTIQNAFSWFAKSMDEKPGEPSALRLVMVYGIVSVVTAWVFVCASRRELVEIPGSVLGFVGTLLTAKFLQKGTEAKSL